MTKEALGRSGIGISSSSFELSACSIASFRKKKTNPSESPEICRNADAAYDSFSLKRSHVDREFKNQEKNIKPSDFRSGIVKEDRYEQALKIQASICAADKNFSCFFFFHLLL